jgi:hypothetical protein
MLLGNAPFIAAHVQGTTAWVDVLYVPAPLRRRGLGRNMFDRWLSTIPSEVTEMKLLAVALDGSSPLAFWRSLGFQREDDPVIVEDFTGVFMTRPAPAAASDEPAVPARKATSAAPRAD